jgi:2-polyprenyl-6-methoxyphenol hydroxylase-like FAD-dependent oxidoreductase
VLSGSGRRRRELLRAPQGLAERLLMCVTLAAVSRDGDCMRVIVVGGGIGGTTAAIALKRKGIDVEVYERAAELAEVGAGVSLWPNALKALHRLGMKARLDSLSFVSRHGAVRSASGVILSRTSADAFTSRFGLPTTVFHRAELLDALIGAAREIPLHLGHECLDIEQDADGVTAFFANGTRARGHLLVGADGLRSVIRKRLGIPGELRYAGYAAWRGIAPFATTELVGGETLGCGRRFGLVPITGNRVYWYATDNAPAGQHQTPAAAKAGLAALFARWHHPIPAIIGATEPSLILRNDIYDRDPVDRWGSGRVTLLGDAAHPMTPNLGQGACQAIEDGLVLARCVAGDPSVASLRRYEAERMPRTAAIVVASRRVGQVGQIQAPALCRIRDMLLRLTPLWATYRQLAPVIGYEGHLGD